MSRAGRRRASSGRGGRGLRHALAATGSAFAVLAPVAVVGMPNAAVSENGVVTAVSASVIGTGTAAANDGGEQFAGGKGEWRALMERAAEATWTRTYRAEVLAVTWDGPTSHSELFELRNDRRGGLTVSSPQRYTMELDAEGSALANHEQGWFVPLPGPSGTAAAGTDPRSGRGTAAGTGAGDDAWAALERKYEVRTSGECLLLQRPCRMLDFRRRSDGHLREQLWIDEATGFVLRRQTYGEDGAPARLLTWLTLDLMGAAPGSRADRDRAVPLQARSQEIAVVSERGRRALREAGWVVPDELPAGYRPTGVYALGGDLGSPLQVVYADGLYHLSVFEQRGRADWSSLPPGVVPAPELGAGVHTWPGALPLRVMWESGDLTFSLVGDVPPDELRRIIASLPEPEVTQRGIRSRLARGFGRLVSWLNPWS